MRLAIVNYAWDPTLATPGSFLDRSAALTGWAEAALDVGCDPVVVCQRFRVRSDVSRHGVTYRFRPDAGKPRPGLSFAEADAVHGSAAAVRPDVVHVNGAVYPSLVRKLRARLPIRAALVVQDHGSCDPSTLSPTQRHRVRTGLSAADALFVPSHARGLEWRDSGAAPPGLAVLDVVAASTTLTPLPRDEARRRSGIEGSPALLWVGSLRAGHDPMAVLRGFALFAGRFPTAHLTMLYDEADLDAAVRLEIARTAVLGPRVRLAGHVPRADVAAYYSAADFFVIGGHADASVTLLEAMACGTVPVVGDTPSNRALTGSERVGALWKPGQPKAFAEALARAAAKPLASERDATRARFESTFSWRAIAWRAAALYRQAMARRRAGEGRPAG